MKFSDIASGTNLDIRAAAQLLSEKRSPHWKASSKKPRGQKPPRKGNTSPHPARGKMVGEESQLNEDMSSWTEAGLDPDIAKYVLRKYQFNHDPDWDEVKKPKASEIHEGNLFMLPNAVVFKHPESRSANAYYVRIEKDQDGKIQEDWTSKISEAFKGLRGSWKRIAKSNWMDAWFRRTKGGMTGAETDAALDQDTLAGSSAGIYSYMNQTFMPRLKPKLEQYVDEIFAGLRKLPKDRDKYNKKFSPRNNSFYQKPSSMREVAISYANVLEQLIEDGFTRRTMEDFLRSYGTLHSGFGSIPDNEQELARLLKTEKMARQKLAKLILDEAKRLKDMVDKLHWKASGGEEAERKLRGEGLEESPVVTRVGHKLDGMVKDLFMNFIEKDHDINDLEQLVRAMGHHLEIDGNRAIIHQLQKNWGAMDEAQDNLKYRRKSQVKPQFANAFLIPWMRNPRIRKDPGLLGRISTIFDRATSPKSALRLLDKETKITFKNAETDADKARLADIWREAYMSAANNMHEENPEEAERLDRIASRWEELASKYAEYAANGRRKLPETEVEEAHGNDSMYDKCWDGYEKVPGKKRGEKGSCRKKTTGKS